MFSREFSKRVIASPRRSSVVPSQRLLLVTTSYEENHFVVIFLLMLVSLVQVAMARTGSGKTAAFLIPLYEKLVSHSTTV
jgi:hypothetical protein